MTGQQLAEQGAQVAANHAESETAGWIDAANKAFAAYIKINRGREFLTEDFRQWLNGINDFMIPKIPSPPDHRAFGNIILKAQRAGLIQHVGYMKVKDPKAHAGPKSVWKAV